ncbi:MAG: hypothetical protein A2X12_09715 [Bacteroidetes bacterium GWE2_29_8]|nr:MAG: hypothetical protein A2X12_09715 [Bacteroidetes bacterium GWE2_29_8]OFY15349.1 MAG: hypothetical protein A2X02_02830 [Bacteroidetes bacterium GWF2_29_10]
MKKIRQILKSRSFFIITIVIASLLAGVLLSVLNVMVESLIYNEGSFLEMLRHDYTSTHHYIENIFIFIFFIIIAVISVFVANYIISKNNLILDSEEKYRKITENTKDIIFKLSLPYFKYEFINESCLEITGYSADDFKKDPLLFTKIIHPDYKYNFIISLKDNRSDDFLHNIRFKIITKNGDIKWLIQKNYNYSVSNNTSFIEGIIIDITEILEAELEIYNKNIELETQNEEIASQNEEIASQNEELQVSNNKLLELNLILKESEEQYRGLYENMLEGVAIHKIIYNRSCLPVDYQIIDCNRAFEKHTGVKCSDAKGTYATKLYKTGNPPYFDIYSKVAETGVPHTFETYFAPMDKYFKITSLSIKKGWFVNIFEDISENKKIEIALRKSEEQYRTLIENTTEVIEKYDTNLKILFVNKAFEIFGNTKVENVIGKTLKDLEFDEKLVDFWEKEMRRALHKQEIINTNYSIKINNELKHYEWLIVPEINNEKAVAVFSFSKEVTDKVNAEKHIQKISLAEKSAKIKQQFVANMSHEIRTPISGIIGIIDFMLKTKLNKKQEEYANLIKSSAETLHNIVNDVLLLSKFEAGKIELFEQEINFHKFINEILDVFASIALSKKINIIKNTEKIPNYIKVDKNRLRQIISNLISNALKFTDKGEIKINISIQKNISKYKSLLKVEVIDTGIGIKTENLDKLFKDFSQIDSSRTKNFDGTGLGLSISKKFANLMGGEIGVSSKENVGSNFWFTFKCEILENLANNVDETQDEIISDNLLKGIHVLLAEDKYVNLIITQKMLQKMGCTVDIAKNGLEAFNLFQPNKYDVVFMDIHMPIMDGLEATKQIKNSFSKEERVL